MLRPTTLTKDSFKSIDSVEAKLEILFDIQTSILDCLCNIEKELRRKRFGDKTAAFLGGLVGGLLAFLGFKINW